MRSSGVLLVSCAGLLFSGGSVLGLSVLWNLLRMSYYFWLSDLGVELGSSILIFAGSLLCLPAGWLSTLVPQHSKSRTFNATLLGLLSVSILLLSLGVSSMTNLSRAVRDSSALNDSMTRAMSLHSFDPNIKTSFAAMQIELKCCGVQSFNDWFKHRRSLPLACCGRSWWNEQREDHCYVPLFSVGCLRPALIELRYFANTLTTLSSALIVVMAVTLFTASYILVTNEEHRLQLSSSKSVARIAIVSHSPTAPQPRFATLVDPAVPSIGNAI